MVNEVVNMVSFLHKLVHSGLISVVFFFGLQSTYAEDLSQVEIDIRNSNGDRTGASNVVFKVYQYTKDTFYTELKPKSDYPYFVTYLPVDQKYRLDGFVNGIFAGSSIIDIKNNYEQIDFVLPKSGGMNLQIVYNDKQTPIIGATVNIKNQDGKILRKDFSDKGGYTLSFNSLPTIREGDFYQVEVSIAENITHTHSPVKLQPGFTRDIKIIAPWPTIIDSLITVYAYDNNLLPITSDDGNYVAELYDLKNTKIANSDFNYRGEAYFSNILVGKYNLLVNNVGENETTVVLNKTISILGDTSELDIIFKPLLISNDGVEDSKQEITSESTSDIVSCNCVAFRLDDIQDYWLNDVQIEIMETFDKKNLPLTIGIIGNEIGEDQEIVSYINQTILKNRLEIANHGWNHEDFTEFDKETQSLLFKQTNKKLQQVFGVTPSVFIPPYNEFDNNTISAMKENYITHFSSSVTLSESPFPLTNSQLYNFPEAAYTGELSPSSTLFVAIEHKLTLSQIQKSISDYGFAVVMMHPQDFSIMENGDHSNKINWNQIRELELLLDRIQIQGLHVVPISKINLDHENIDKIPHWVRQFSIWWSEGKISDEEYANGLKFYRENGIINA
jgi:peptidoglycan/xylan/chitin deacetylase (PgdA/CDA1 family)